jgi:hypothetical protein
MNVSELLGNFVRISCPSLNSSAMQRSLFSISSFLQHYTIVFINFLMQSSALHTHTHTHTCITSSISKHKTKSNSSITIGLLHSRRSKALYPIPICIKVTWMGLSIYTTCEKKNWPNKFLTQSVHVWIKRSIKGITAIYGSLTTTSTTIFWPWNAF